MPRISRRTAGTVMAATCASALESRRIGAKGVMPFKVSRPIGYPFNAWMVSYPACVTPAAMARNADFESIASLFPRRFYCPFSRIEVLWPVGVVIASFRSWALFVMDEERRRKKAW